MHISLVISCDSTWKVERSEPGGGQGTEWEERTAHRGDIWIGTKPQFQSSDWCGGVRILSLAPWSSVNVWRREQYVDGVILLQCSNCSHWQPHSSPWEVLVENLPYGVDCPLDTESERENAGEAQTGTFCKGQLGFGTNLWKDLPLVS